MWAEALSPPEGSEGVESRSKQRTREVIGNLEKILRIKVIKANPPLSIELFYRIHVTLLGGLATLLDQ